MQDKFLFFGYGPTRDSRVMQALTGNKDLVGHEAVLKGYKLNLQTLNQVPKSPREILKESFPDGFEFFVVSPDENKEVAGTVWELTAQERDLIRDFELIDLGWYKDSRGKAQTSDGKELDVEVAALREEQKVSREVDGIHHEVWFNCKPEDFMRVAEKAQREFLEKNKS